MFPQLYGSAVITYSCFEMWSSLLDVLGENTGLEVTEMETEPQMMSLQLICIPQQINHTKVKKLFLLSAVHSEPSLILFLHTLPPFLCVVQTLGGFDFD